MKRKLLRLLNINSDERVNQLKNKSLTPLVQFLAMRRVHPTTVTLLGLLLGVISAFLVIRGMLVASGFALLGASLSDAVDGYLAKVSDKQSIVGAFVDGICDRYVDLSILLGLLWYFVSQENSQGALLISLTIIGTAITSYSTPHALSLSSILEKRQIGFFGRPQRLATLIIALVFPGTLAFMCLVLAVFTNITAFHRIIFYLMIFTSSEKV